MIHATFSKLRIYKELPIQQLHLDGPASQKFENQQILLAIHQDCKERFHSKITCKKMVDFRALNPALDFKPFDKVQKDTYMGEYWGRKLILSLRMYSQFEPMKPDFFAFKGSCVRYSRFPFYGEIRHQPIVL